MFAFQSLSNHFKLTKLNNMKKQLISFLLLFLFVFTITSCKKTDSTPTPFKCATCHTTPDALAANDNSSKGMYKGVMIGSTGTIQFNLLNGGTTITAILVIDGVTINLSSSVTWVNGQAYVAPFTGTLGGSPVSITFSVNNDGTNPIITSSNIPGHPNASFVILKELSTSLLESFEGTYHTTKPKDGTFNIILSRSLKVYYAIARENGSSSTDASHGTIINNSLTDVNGTSIGTLSGDQLTGNFRDGGNFTVTITGQRTN